MLCILTRSRFHCRCDPGVNGKSRGPFCLGYESESA
ncbi:MAG: hypothetical protein GF398_05875 [Chitinivibrionales bacterium]|nr:hypothetical protein [Chitinivibrionales bacterium]